LSQGHGENSSLARSSRRSGGLGMMKSYLDYLDECDQ
jgi:hypothetical protein